MPISWPCKAVIRVFASVMLARQQTAVSFAEETADFFAATKKTNFEEKDDVLVGISTIGNFASDGNEESENTKNEQLQELVEQCKANARAAIRYSQCAYFDLVQVLEMVSGNANKKEIEALAQICKNLVLDNQFAG